MKRHEITNLYFEWMYDLVCGKQNLGDSYHRLFHFLNTVEFSFVIPMDGNRAEDGIDLRYRFGYEHDYPGALIATYLDDRPCSILEMLIALAIRCEEHIMSDPDIGDRTEQWFWIMVTNLGLNSMTDKQFDEDRANEIVERFISRKYQPNGEGGLFTIDKCKRDLRAVEIWYQMCWYLDTIV